jgi:hypothetical protein
MMDGKTTQLPAKYRPDFARGMDGRYALPRALKRARATIVADLGGESTLTYLQLSLVDRTVFREAVIADLERQYSDAREAEMESLEAGDADDLERARTAAKLAADVLAKLDQSTNSYLALCARLGLKRRAKTVDLQTYVANGAGGDDD